MSRECSTVHMLEVLIVDIMDKWLEVSKDKIETTECMSYGIIDFLSKFTMGLKMDI